MHYKILHFFDIISYIIFFSLHFNLMRSATNAKFPSFYIDLALESIEQGCNITSGDWLTRCLVFPHMHLNTFEYC